MVMLDIVRVATIAAWVLCWLAVADHFKAKSVEPHFIEIMAKNYKPGDVLTFPGFNGVRIVRVDLATNTIEVEPISTR